MIRRRTYHPISEAPRDGTPIIAVCGGVECVICWDDPGVIPAAYWEGPPLDCWCYWDEDDGGETMTPIRSPLSGWRRLF